MPRDKLNTIAEGIFFSLLNYCVEVYGNVWGLPTYDDQERKSTAFRKEDNMKLQILVNKVLRSLTGLESDTTVSVLSSVSGKLSVQQRTAFFTINSVHRSMQTREPQYSYSTLKPTANLENEVPRYDSNCNMVHLNSQYPGVDITIGGVVCTTYFQPASHKASHKQHSRRGPSNGFKPTFRYFHLR